MHKCKYIFIHCIDFRLGGANKGYQEKEGILGNCDEASAAGGVNDIEFVLKQVGVSVSLHGTKEVILCNHTDCGAYGGSKEFVSAEEERKFHTEELKKAKETVLQKHPSLTVRMLLAEIQPSGIVVFKEL